MGISTCESSGSGRDVRRVISPGAGFQAGEQPWVPGVAGTQKSRASHPASDSGPPGVAAGQCPSVASLPPFYPPSVPPKGTHSGRWPRALTSSPARAPCFQPLPEEAELNWPLVLGPHRERTDLAAAHSPVPTSCVRGINGALGARGRDVEAARRPPSCPDQWEPQAALPEACARGPAAPQDRLQVLWLLVMTLPCLGRSVPVTPAESTPHVVP